MLNLLLLESKGETMKSCLLSLLMYQHWKYLETLKDITNKTPRILKNPPFQILRHHRNMLTIFNLCMFEMVELISNDFYMISINALLYPFIIVYHPLFPVIPRFPARLHFPTPGTASDKEKTSRLQRSESIIQKTPTAIFSLCCLNKLAKKNQKTNWDTLVL